LTPHRVPDLRRNASTMMYWTYLQPMDSAKSSSHLAQDDHGIVYDVQTRWKDLHLPTFVAASSALYFVEQLVGHPLEVIRTRLQVDEKVRPSLPIHRIRNFFRNLCLALCINSIFRTKVFYLPSLWLPGAFAGGCSAELTCCCGPLDCSEAVLLKPIWLNFLFSLHLLESC
jgi:hypothetical protein